MGEYTRVGLGGGDGGREVCVEPSLGISSASLFHEFRSRGKLVGEDGRLQILIILL